MARIGTTAQSYFDASHVLEGDDFCGGDHGHTFKVTAHVVGDLEVDISGIWRVQGAEDLYGRLDRIVSELDGRNLNKMMPGAQPTPEGIANWVLERIPTADWVEVEMGWRHLMGRAYRDKKR